MKRTILIAVFCTMMGSAVGAVSAKVFDAYTPPDRAYYVVHGFPLCGRFGSDGHIIAGPCK